MNKISWPDAVVPTVPQFETALNNWGPQALLAGISLAGIKNLAGMISQLKTNSIPKKNNDQLTVELPPQKTAGIISDFLDQAARGVRKHMASTVAGAASNIDPLVQGAKGVAQDVGKGMAAHPYMTGIPAAGAAAAGIYGGSHLLPNPPGPGANYIFDDAMGGVAALGIGGLGYMITNHILMNRRKSQMQGQLDAAKNQYSHLLGQSLASPEKVATVGDPDEYFPAIHGLCNSMVDSLYGNQKIADGPNIASNFLSSPSLLGVLAAVMAHQFVYNRMNQVDQMHQYEKPKPPKNIRLVSSPQQPIPLSLPAPSAEDLQTPAPVQEDERKTAMDIPEILGTIGLMKNEEGQPEQGTSVQPPLPTEPTDQMITNNTAEIISPEGNTVVQSGDPGVTAQLPAATHRLMKIMQSLNATTD